jgi:hypothetical protein
MQPDPHMVSEVRTLADSGADLEDAIAHLRAAGCHQVESIKVLREVYGISLRDADEAILSSETWADLLEETLELRDAFWTEAAEWADDISSDDDGNLELTFDLRRSDDELLVPNDLLAPKRRRWFRWRFRRRGVG